MKFEWALPAARAGALWAPLMVLIAAPWPAFGWPLPERAMPIMWLLLAGGALVALRLARASAPLALLFGWMIVRAALMQFPQRAIQLLLLIAMVGLLYVAAREMSPPLERWAAWGLVAGAAYEGFFGALNYLHIYPWMTFVIPDQMGRPMGFLTHPNYWGSYMALGLPVVAALGGLLPAAAIYLMIVASWSGGPAISASVGALVCLWPELGRRARYAAIALGSAAVAAVMTMHEWRLSGRREVWQAVWPELIRYPFIGQGLGSWRIWADHYNAKASTAAGSPVVFATLQAHQEQLQLWFELGLIGLGLGALWAWQAWEASRRAWQFCPPDSSRAWWAPGRLPLGRAWLAVLATALVNSLGSPTFHLPAQAAITLFALARIQAAAAEPWPEEIPKSMNGHARARAVRAAKRKPAPITGVRA